VSINTDRNFNSRRGCAIAFAALTFFALPAVGQWPKGGTDSKSKSQQYVKTEGCAVNPSDLPQLLSSIRYTVIMPNNDADMEIFRGLWNGDRLMSRAFDVDVTYGLYDDESPNAFATATDISEMNARDGTVLIGRKLIASERRSNPRIWMASATFVLAHEYAHIFQFKRGVEIDNPHFELQADYLAGWWLGQENAKGSVYYTNMSVVRDSLLAKGSYAFNSTEFHGTASQRREALSRGYNAGYSGLPLQDAFDESSEVVMQIASNSG
jgi:hypothetical protein